MAVITNLALGKREDATIGISMTPPLPLGGVDLQFLVTHRFGGGSVNSGLILKSVASGYNGQSGITITNSGAGNFNVSINSLDTSGLEFGNYAYSAERTSSGQQTLLSTGFILLMPGVQ